VEEDHGVVEDRTLVREFSVDAVDIS
jgi:hypothetical protein